MAYNWKEESEKEPLAPKLPPGQHQAAISRVVYESRDGNPFRSGAGDPQIMIIWKGPLGEAADMITLSDKAAWRLARILRATESDIDQLMRRQVEPFHFASPTMGDKLIGKSCRIEVAYEQDKAHPDREYARVNPVLPRSAETAEQKPAAPATLAEFDPDQIPI